MDVIGDSDPIDMYEISGTPCTPGQVQTVKVLGAVAVVDDGEMDWKVVGIDINANGSTINELSSQDKTDLRWFI